MLEQRDESLLYPIYIDHGRYIYGQ